MSRVPVISSPCPFRWSSMPTPGQDFCGQCQRSVHNLDLMSADQRNDFMNSCSGEVCVSYTVRRPISNFALGLGLAAGLASAGVSAQDATNSTKQIESKLVQSVQEWKSAEADTSREIYPIEVVGGTILDANSVRWVDESEVDVSAVALLPEATEMEWLKTPDK